MKKTTNDDMDIYPSPRNIFQQKIRDLFKRETEEARGLMADLLKLFCLFKLNRSYHSRTWKSLNEIFNQFGIQTFVELMDMFEGKTIKFPSKREMKDVIMASLCYYYKEIERKPWDEIKTILGIQDNNTIQYGIKVRQLKAFIEQGLTPTIFNPKDAKHDTRREPTA
jgi:hypothetical protein